MENYSIDYVLISLCFLQTDYSDVEYCFIFKIDEKLHHGASLEICCDLKLLYIFVGLEQLIKTTIMVFTI